MLFRGLGRGASQLHCSIPRNEAFGLTTVLSGIVDDGWESNGSRGGVSWEKAGVQAVSSTISFRTTLNAQQ